MGFFDIAYSVQQFFQGSGAIMRWGVEVQDAPAKKDPEPTNMSTVYKCSKVLAENISRIPKSIKKDGRGVDHWADERINRPNSYQNSQQFWSTLEMHCCICGDGLVDKRSKEGWHIIPPKCFEDYKFTGGVLEYKINWKLDIEYFKRNPKDKEVEWLSSDDVFHFKGVSTDGIKGLSPIDAAMMNLKIQSNATNTIISFYNNNAMAPMALRSTIDTPTAFKAFKEGVDQLEKDGSGIQKAGGFLKTPPNTEIQPLNVQFADAQLVDTMKFTRDEIAGLYGIPSYMMNDKETVNMDIEQQSLSFKTFTIAPRVEMYKQELERKIFKYKEIKQSKFEIFFDVDVLVEMDLKRKIDAYTTGITKGLYTPNFAISKVGGDLIEEAYGDYHYLQDQYKSIERRGDESSEFSDASNKGASTNTISAKNGKSNNKDDTK